MTTRIVQVVAMTALVTAGGGSGPGAQAGIVARDRARFVYAIRVLCGFAGSTTINVHNPNGLTVSFTRRGVPLELGQDPTPPHDRQQESLGPDWALLMGCEDIAGLGAVGTTGSGDVIIESRHELDVWATYTSIVAGGGVGETRVVRVPSTRVGR